MKDAGIKVWVLTGDKIETAINIGFSCGLIDNDMHQILVTGNDTESVQKNLNEASKFVDGNYVLKQPSAVVVGGESLLRIELSPKLREQFLEVVENCTVVLACRVSPK